jgi:MFS transporter, DHA1 family, inner membrane transport protein
VWSYIAPYLQSLFAPSKALFSGILLWFGMWGVAGNVLASRSIARRGAPFNVHVSLVSMALGVALLLLVGTSVAGFALCSIFWGVGVFANNSSQQARLGAAAPALAGASLALNTSMMYLGQAVGAGAGGVLIAHSGYRFLPMLTVGFLCVALAISVHAARRANRAALSRVAPSRT